MPNTPGHPNPDGANKKSIIALIISGTSIKIGRIHIGYGLSVNAYFSQRVHEAEDKAK